MHVFHFQNKYFCMEKCHHPRCGIYDFAPVGRNRPLVCSPVPQGAALGYAFLPLQGVGRLIGHKGSVRVLAHRVRQRCCV